MTEPRLADATPSKSFFIDMLTRDISVADAILDLVDNAVDKAVETDALDVMNLLRGETAGEARGRSIEVGLYEDEFTIRDTCGGIGLQEADDTVFLFGNPNERGADFGLSVYGIGMKRAFFKLGSRVEMRSSTATDWWATTWPIAEWRRQRRWKVAIDRWGDQDAGESEPGSTSIRIMDLHRAISPRFSQPSFIRELQLRIASTYALFLKAGIEISINGQLVEPALPILATAPLAPARHQWISDGVEVLLIAGVSPIEDQAPRGWYVFCNGRMVLEADKSVETGWGDVLPQFRSKYNHFLGYVYFRSADVRLLPWRTTKQGVERESPVYQQALSEMRLQSRPVLNYLNDLYPSDSQADPALERAWLQQAGTVLITDLSTIERTFEYAPRRRQARQDISIQYRRLKTDVERIRRYLDDPSLSAGSIGGLTFDYYLEQVDD